MTQATTERPLATLPAERGGSSSRGQRKVRTGYVISDKMDKTVVVQVTVLKAHPLYKKTLQQRVRFKAHDEQNQCGVGDLVRIMETRPISKQKRWRVVEILEKAK
jgi:small subunit ribosomal protein S17